MGGSRFEFYRPRLPLAEHVELFWHVGGGNAVPQRELVLPSTSVELVIALHDAPYRLCGADRATVLSSTRGGVLCGLRQEPVVLDLKFQHDDVGVHFKPGGAAAVLGVPVDELRPAHVPFGDVLGREAETLRDALGSTHDLVARFRILERFLTRRLEKSRYRDEDAGVRVALSALERSAGSATVETILGRLGWTGKKLAGRFARRVGLTPKRYGRIRRMEHLMELLQEDSRRSSGASLAGRGGFYDQAHMINDFRELTGVTPRDYARWEGAMFNHLPL